MRSIKLLTLMLTFMLLSLNVAFAQFEDDELEEETTDLKCIPENLTAPFDSLSEEDLAQSIGLQYNFGYEYY